ncbi:FG-GAP-like repeat-containing protein [Streptomyces sp. NPDC048111]|uniref:FG-GAP-like repeat-containing protein n=1 Tax=Streptomyces sp. NPDC048111 TaxID=3365500 RepID=UPI003710FA44
MRSAIAVVMAAGIGAGLLPLTAGVAYAAPAPGAAYVGAAPGELTIPAVTEPDPNAGVLVGGGATGYLWGRAWDGYNWTSYADGSVRPVPVPDGLRTAEATGGDTIVFRDAAARKVVQRNMADGTERTITLPQGQAFVAGFGDAVLTYAGRSALHLLTWEDGRVQDRAVTGLPADAIGSLSMADAKNGQGVLVLTEGPQAGGDTRATFWVDRSGRARPTGVPFVSNTPMSGSRFASWSHQEDDVVQIWDAAADLTKPVNEVKVARSDAVLMGVVGDSLLFSATVAADDTGLFAMPLTGGPERLVFDQVEVGEPAFTPDGGMLIARNDAPAGRRVVEVRQAGDGALTVRDTAPAPQLRTAVNGLSLAQGRLTTAEQRLWNGSRLRGIDLAVSGPVKAGQPVDLGAGSDFFSHCDTVECAALQATGDGRLAFEGRNGTVVGVLAEGEPLRSATLIPIKAYQQPDSPFEASGRYGVVRLTGQPWPITVVDLDTSQPVYTGRPDTELARPAYALAGSTLWAETTTGSAEAVDVRTGKTLATAKVSDCDLTSLQANGTNLLWECGSSASGVYDTATRRSTALPAHQSARLGDGYVAWQQGGVLSVTDVRGASGTRVLGTPKRGEPGKGWAVDRFGGPVAYTDAEDAVHIVPTGVPTSALGVLDTDAPGRVDVNSGSWKPRWWLNKPAASWQLTLKDGTGATVRTLSGGEARGLVRPEWDGKADGGRYAVNGSYAWTLTVTPADGQGEALTRTGTVGLTGGLPVARDYVGTGGPDGRADILALTPSGRFDLRTGPGLAGVTRSGEGWTGANALTAAIPYRDVNGDRCNDVLVRTAEGELRVYTPGCGAPLTPSTPYKSLGRGWNAYDSLVSPGDVDGDGRADLVARTSGGDLYVYADNGALGFKAPVKAGWGWGGLLVVGAGDLTGDGRGDVLARDASGVLWTYPGNGRGGFGDRIRLGAGWGGFDALVGAGDLDGDGRTDLLAREESGMLWLYPGAGNGAFGERKQLGGGWNAYKSLY